MNKFTKEDFYKALEEAGHKLIRDEDGEIDIFILDADYHNGPGCESCGKSWCHHCRNETEIEKCEKTKKKTTK